MRAGPIDWFLGRIADRLRSRYGLDPAHAGGEYFGVTLEGVRTFLHVGCGHKKEQHTVAGFGAEEWREIRLDADPTVYPDIVASITDMHTVPKSGVDAVYSAHNLEHLYPHEVPLALSEFHRVLRPDGFLILTCPDLQSICKLVVEDKLEEPAYLSSAGPIAPIDVLYGHRLALSSGNLFMAHHSGFTLRTLLNALRSAGFLGCFGFQRESAFDIWVIAHKNPLTEGQLKSAAVSFLP